MEVIMQGVIVAVLQPQQGVSQRTQQPWVSQEYVLCHEQGQYPRNVCFRVFGQDKIQQMAIRQGEYLTVHLNIDAKASTSKPGQYFNSIDCWKVERQAQQVYAPQPGYAPQPAPYPAQPVAQPAPFPAQQPVQQPVAAPFPPAAPVAAAPQPAPFPPAQPQPQPAPAPAPQPAPQPQVQQPTQSPLPFPPAQ